ncbi:hypothetical protein NPIL_529791 [Nephila pilipes]|uniref:Uncharacterized protein n=2 Tax=Nephila pilipes TaxID=299642 RepID=A0A8X6PWD9_NEPPI|nr:hypothetical protein NPIL_529791 [Nephila pilipes]
MDRPSRNKWMPPSKATHAQQQDLCPFRYGPSLIRPKPERVKRASSTPRTRVNMTSLASPDKAGHALSPEEAHSCDGHRGNDGGGGVNFILRMERSDLLPDE